MTIKTRLFARIGEFFLEEAIVDVLLKAQQNKQRLHPAEISRQAGIFRKRNAVGVIDNTSKTVDMMHDSIVSGVLNKLWANGKAQLSEDGWELIENEVPSGHENASATSDFFDFLGSSPANEPSKPVEPTTEGRPTTRLIEYPMTSPDLMLYNRERNIMANARIIDGVFTVLKESELSMVYTGYGYYKDLHEKTIADEEKVQNVPLGSEKGVFKRDVPFNRASAAASVVQGRESNGNKEWKVKDTNDPFGDWLKRTSQNTEEPEHYDI